MPVYKTCPGCDIEKSDAEFARDHSKALGLATYCRACHKRRRKFARQKDVRMTRLKDRLYYAKKAEYKREAARRKREAKPPPCRKAASKWLANRLLVDPDYFRNLRLKHMYGITVEEERVMFARQNGGCAICGRKDSGRKGKRMNIDHCHKSGVVRGILCFGCNTLLGHSFDNPATLRAAADYLEMHRA